jgi:hypothetical protein
MIRISLNGLGWRNDLVSPAPFPRPEFKSLREKIILHKLEAQAPETEMVSSILGLE